MFVCVKTNDSLVQLTFLVHLQDYPTSSVLGLIFSISFVCQIYLFLYSFFLSTVNEAYQNGVKLLLILSKRCFLFSKYVIVLNLGLT